MKVGGLLAAETLPTFVVAGSRVVSAEAMPTVTFAPKKLTAAKKGVMAQQDNAAAAERLATDGSLTKVGGRA